MSQFDPYYKWLGIPPKEQPPHFYRLLGISLYEKDVDVISAAADRCMAFIQQHALGEHVEESQQLLNELAAARICLLAPSKKANYDSQLRARLNQLSPVISAERNDAENDRKQVSRTKEQSYQQMMPIPMATLVSEPPTQKRKNKINLHVPAALDPHVLRIAGIVAGVACLLVLVVWFSLPNDNGNDETVALTDNRPVNPSLDEIPTANTDSNQSFEFKPESKPEKKPTEPKPEEKTPDKLHTTSQKVPFREPVYLAVVDLIASPGRTMLVQIKESKKNTKPKDTKPNNAITKADVVDDDFAAGKTKKTSNASDIPKMDRPDELWIGDEYKQEISIEKDPNALLISGYPAEKEGGMALPSSTQGVAVRYISVRGIFDLQKQIQNYARALGVDESSAKNLVKFIDFKLERETASSSKGPWEGKWDPVDITVAKQYLAQTLDYDQDSVFSGIRDAVITMPLPFRLMGVWRNKVNHPTIKEFNLSDEEMKAEAVLNRKIIDDYRKQKKPIVQEVRRGGFAGYQLDMGQLQQSYFSLKNKNQAQGLVKVFDEEFKGIAEQDRYRLIEKIKEQVDAAGELVLFRYIDFDIEPGKSYKYRVQLILRNPNFDTPVDQVNTPSVVEGQLRKTPVSEPSNVATVAEDYAYFLTHISTPRGSASKMAKMTIYEWFDETGTMIKGKFEVELGGYIGGVQEVYVLRPDEMTFEKEEDIPFKSSDLLIDAMLVRRLNRELHADLWRPENLSRHESGIPSEALVLDYEGRLKSIDPISLASLQKKYESNYDLEKKPFEDLKNAREKALTATDAAGLFGPDGKISPEKRVMDEMKIMSTGTGRLWGRKRNPSRPQGNMTKSFYPENSPSLKLLPAPSNSPATIKPSLLIAPFSKKQAGLQQAAWAKRLNMSVVKMNRTGMEMVLIPPGEFSMGSPELEKGGSNEHPLHKVQITKPFYLAATEVTQGQWLSVMRTIPRDIKVSAKTLNYPVTYVTWKDTQKFIKELSRKEGVQYRLPTEAEWEYACRAGSESKYCFGKSTETVKEYAWFSKNTWDANEKYAHQVGLKLPNSFGLFDLHGNVYEWCSDLYNEDYYDRKIKHNPAGPSLGSTRVVRGGSWYDDLGGIRSANRNNLSSTDRNLFIGFRVVRVIK